MQEIAMRPSTSPGSRARTSGEEEEQNDDDGADFDVAEARTDRRRDGGFEESAEIVVVDASTDRGGDDDHDDDDDPPLLLCHHRTALDAELRHLERRIRNVRETSIRSSRDAIASDVGVYRSNALNATRNCVREWRSIARRYRDDDDDGGGISPALREETGLAVFQLIQLTVQSGPLTGGKPGYFKRCGSEIAGTVLEFLEEVVPGRDVDVYDDDEDDHDHDLGADRMGFSSKQMDAMRRWMRNAAKAVESGKPPSKSVGKKLVEGRSKKSRKKKKK